MLRPITHHRPRYCSILNGPIGWATNVPTLGHTVRHFMNTMSDTNTSIFEQSFRPLYQALIALGGVILIGGIGKLISLSGAMEVSQRFPWMTAAALLLLFALFNSVFSVSTKNTMKYYGRSIYCFLGLAVTSGLVAWGLSSLTINEAGSYRWIFIVVTFGYLVFLCMMAFLRKIVEFAQREEWNHPRMRNKKK